MPDVDHRKMQSLPKAVTLIPNGMDKWVCAACVEDQYLKEELQRVGGAGDCSYCSAAGVQVISFMLLLSLVENGLGEVYEDALPRAQEQQRSWEELGFSFARPLRPRGLWSKEVLQQERVTANAALLDDLMVAFGQAQIWTSHEMETGDDGTLNVRSYVVNLALNWHRYTLFDVSADQTAQDGDAPTPRQALNALIDLIKDRELITEIPAGEKWWRARKSDEGLAFIHASELGTADYGVTPEGRMSPRGIPLFYGGQTESAALREVAAHTDVDAAVTIGCFTQKRVVHVVDLTKIPRVFSLFDRSNACHRTAIKALIEYRDIIQDPGPLEGEDDAQRIGALPIPPFPKASGSENPKRNNYLHYIGSQLLTEYMRFHIDDLDGLIWESVAEPGTKSCALFLSKQETDGMENHPYISTLDDALYRKRTGCEPPENVMSLIESKYYESIFAEKKSRGIQLRTT